MLFKTPLSTPLSELAVQARHELLEHWLDYSRASDHARRLQAASPVLLTNLIATAPSAAVLAAELAQIEIIPVLTSHPSEMRPVEVLAALAQSDSVESAMSALHGIDKRVNLERPMLAHEVATLLQHFSHVIFDAVSDFYEDLERAARSRFGEAAPAIPTLLRFHSWVGCDRDGNPECTAARTTATAAQMHHCIVERYCNDLTELAQQSHEHAAMFAALYNRLAPIDGVANMSPANFSAEIVHLQTVAHPPIVARNLARLARRFATFGFHVATLEWRQHSDFILFAFDERAHALHPTNLHMSELDAAHRAARIRESLHDETTLTDYEHLLTTPKAVELLHSLRALAQIRARFGADAVGELIISNCEDTPVILALERLARDTGVFACGEIPIVPLFESLSALERGPNIVATLLSEPMMRDKVARLNNRLEIMVGYSDAAKDGGRIAADLLMKDAQHALISECALHGITPHFFHGRGGSFGRGYATFAEAFTTIDRRIPAGQIKITEQGELVANRYGHPALAAHTLRSWFREALSAIRRCSQPHESETSEALDLLESRVATECTRVFRNLRESTTFMESVRSLTQLDIVRGFPLSSRPASRNEGRQTSIDLASLRAVPFNMAFNLAFAQVPAWFGTGSALHTEIQHSGSSQLRLAYQHRPVFRFAIERARAALEASNLSVLHERSNENRQSAFFAEIAAEDARAREAIAVITGTMPTPSVIATEHPYVTELLRFLQSQQDEIDRDGCYLALATIAATVGMTG